MGQPLKARGNTTIIFFLYGLELACAHKFLEYEDVHKESEDATSLREGLQNSNMIRPKACRENVYLDKNEFYVCVCMGVCACISVAWMPCFSCVSSAYI